MSVVETDIQKLKSLLDQADKALKSIDPTSQGGFEIKSAEEKVERLKATLRTKENKMGVVGKEVSESDISHLESQQEQQEREQKKYEEEIRILEDKQIRSNTGLQAEQYKLKSDLTSLKSEESRLEAKHQVAETALKQAKTELPRLVEADEKIEKLDREEKAKARREKEAADLKKRVGHERDLREKSEKNLKEVETKLKKQAEEIDKQSQEKPAKKEVDVMTGLDLSKKEDKDDEKKIQKRRQRGRKKLQRLQAEAHGQGSVAANNERILQLKGKAQRGGMSDTEKEEYKKLKETKTKSKR